jgi:hypothetical protein
MPTEFWNFKERFPTRAADGSRTDILRCVHYDDRTLTSHCAWSDCECGSKSSFTSPPASLSSVLFQLKWLLIATRVLENILFGCH